MFEPLGVRPGDPLYPLLREFEPHADGIEGLQEIVVKILAQAFSLLKCLADCQFAAAQRLFSTFLLRDVGADGDETFLALQHNHFCGGEKAPHLSSL